MAESTGTSSSSGTESDSSSSDSDIDDFRTGSRHGKRSKYVREVENKKTKFSRSKTRKTHRRKSGRKDRHASKGDEKNEPVYTALVRKDSSDSFIPFMFSLKSVNAFDLWHDIAESMGLVSERARSSDPLHASSVRNKTLVDSLPDIITAADKLKSIITDIRTYTGAVSLDITNGSMASPTAEGFYVTLVNGVQYLSDYFKYTGKENLLNEIKVKTLGTRMIEGFYGHVTEKNPGNNPTVLQFSKRVATEAFHFVIPAVTSDNTMCQNVSVRRTRDEVSSTYTYAAVGSDDNETSSDAMWAMFQQRHEHCFTTEDLRKVKTNLENGKDIDPALLKAVVHWEDGVLSGVCEHAWM